jgi:ADP-heptose:LPS heptosyltransferase/GT2 family glycosyltransferase
LKPPAGLNELIGQKSSGVSSFGTLRRKISQAEIDLYSDMLTEIRWHPRFGVIVLVDDGCEAIERARNTITSVCSQAYANWRLVLVGDDSGVALRDRLADGRDDVRTLLNRLLDRTGDWKALSAGALDGFDQFQERIEVLELGRTDPLYRLAGRGEDPPVFLGILTAGDELGCDAFLELAVASGLNRDCDFFYSDELCVNPPTGMLEEFFKPQWSPDLLLSTNYIGRFWCATRELLERTEITLADLLRFGEYDVVLRCAEQSREFRHIPSVLCRRPTRRLDSEAGMKLSLERALERRGIEGEVAAGYGPGTYRLKRRVARDLVSIIIATCGSRGLIKPCLTSLREITAYPNFEIICLDNIPAADQDLKNWLRVNSDKVVEIDEPFNWSYFNNRGAAAADGQLLLFLNDDVEIIDPGWLEALVEHAQRPEVGVVGAQLLFPNRTVQHGGVFLEKLGHARHAFRHRRQNDPGYFGLALTQRNASAVTGACLMTRREIFVGLGGFNEAHDIINNDLDYCLKARARRLLCVFTPYARLVHHERASRKAREDYDDDAFNRQWWTVFGKHDPYHHPRLSREIDDIVPEAEAVEVFYIVPPLFARESVCKILLLELYDIDGCIGSIPAIRRLRAAFPSARLYVLGGRWSQPVWSLVPEVDQFIAFDFISGKPLSTFKAPEAEACRDLRQRLEPYQFDIAIDLHTRGATRPVLECTGARYLAGFKQDSEFPWLDIALQWDGNIPGPAKPRHFSGDLVSLVKVVAAESETRRDLIVGAPTGRSPSAGLRLANSLDRPLACVHPAAGDEVRRWPSEYFAELVDLLVDRNGAHVALLGLPGEEEIATRVQRRLRDCSHVSNLAGMLEFSDLADLLKKSALFVGNNSGLLHLAAGLGVPTVGIHSAILDPRESGPVGPRTVGVWRHVHCSPCRFSRPEQCNRDLLCLTGLRPVDVYPVCKRFLTIWAGRTAAHCHGGCSREFEEECVDQNK